MIRLVTFDALHTLLTPRLPFYTQYAQIFEPFLGPIPPPAIKRSFKLALAELQRTQPAYAEGATGFWTAVIQRTAVGAGADPKAVERSLPKIVPTLLKRFSSAEGYKLFDDALRVVRTLKDDGVQTGLVTNADSRILAAMEDLGILQHFSPVVVSEYEGIEKPALEVFQRACERGGVSPSEALHVGDELEADYRGAQRAGMQALLLRREGPDGEEAHKVEGEDLSGVSVVSNLDGVVDFVRRSRKSQ
ncbi:HAD-like protein [Dentipellis sp. KUC8613]|nr:HAD-like protein [Dentipellis sp. KUC8613]